MKLIKKLKKGFTLIELVVVIAIIAILGGVSVGVYVGITNSAKESAAKQEASTFATIVRAAALTDADGYEVKEFSITNNVITIATDAKVSHLVKFDVDHMFHIYTVDTNGIASASEAVASGKTDMDVLKAVYFQYEELKAEDSICKGTFKEAKINGEEETLTSDGKLSYFNYKSAALYEVKGIAF